MKKSSNPLKFVWLFLALNLLISSVAIVLTFALRQERKIAYVDAIKLISKYKGMDEAKKKFNLKNETFKLNLDSLSHELQIAIDTYGTAKQRLTPKEKQLMEALIQSKEKQYLNYEQLVQEQYQKNEQELSSQILKEVNEYVRKYGDQKGYAIILSATHTGNIAYGDKSYDITEEVLNGLNSQYNR